MKDKFSFRVPQKALIQKRGKYLIVKRSPQEEVYPEAWDFPGGKLEHKESPSKGLQREVWEETKLKIKVGKPAFTFSEIIDEIPILFIVYRCNAKNGRIRLSHEHTEYRWADRKEIQKLKTEKYVKAYFKSIK